MMKKFAAIILLLIGAVAMGDELDVARDALRDGLYELARTHARSVDGDAAKLIILESYARESKWKELLITLDQWKEFKTDGAVYYRSLALAETGSREEAVRLMSSYSFKDPSLLMAVIKLKSQLAIADGNCEEALKMLKAGDLVETDCETRMLAADGLKKIGSMEEAIRLWRMVIADTNSNEKASALAAMNLGDRESLETVERRIISEELQRRLRLRIGILDLNTPETFDAGAKRLKEVIAASPDTEGAGEAMLTLARACLETGRNQEAAEIFRQALEIWPKLAQIDTVQENRGWALRKLGKFEEATEAFARAEELSTNLTVKARSAMERGDVLIEAGRRDEADKIYRETVARYPKTPAGEKLAKVLRLREAEAEGRRLYAAHDFVAAGRIFAGIAAEDPSRKTRMDYLAMLCLYGRDRYEEACSKAREIVEKGDDQVIRSEAKFWLAKYAANRRNWKEASKLFFEYADEAPTSPAAPVALMWSVRTAFADNDYERSILVAARLIERFPTAPETAASLLTQGEALMALARFDEAIIVFDKVIDNVALVKSEDRLKAQILRADANFTLGADNPARYLKALESYQSIRLGESLTTAMRFTLAFKIGRTLEKLKRYTEAEDQYYSEVMEPYRRGLERGQIFDDEATAAFSKAAFRLADAYESRGLGFQALRILEDVVACSVPSSAEAGRRIEKLKRKGFSTHD